ncbi:MAG: hypothetical protein WBP34_07315 [Thermoanaerobaculia bacterium]
MTEEEGTPERELRAVQVVARTLSVGRITEQVRAVVARTILR